MTFFVTGATGNQGGAAARSLLRQGARVKALVRNPSSSAAFDLKKSGAELVQGNLNEVDRFRSEVKGVDGIFCALTFRQGVDKELAQGTGLVDLAKACQVKHFVYSSVTGAELNTGIPHFESKFRIENHLRQSGVPYTILQPASFYENFLIPQVRSRILKGKLTTPINQEKVQQFIGTKDIGEMAAGILLNPGKHFGETMRIAADQMDMAQVAALFTETLGKEVSYSKLPTLITRLFMGKDLYIMFKWINENNAIFIDDISSFRKAHPGLTGLREWIAANFGQR